MDTQGASSTATDEGRQATGARKQDEHAEHGSHDHSDHGDHRGHGDHHAQMVADFRRRFWVSLLLTVPILLLSPLIQSVLGIEDMLQFPSDLTSLSRIAEE